MQDTERGDGASHTDRDPDSNIVDFDGPSDPAKAVNWTRSKKWANILVLSTMTFITPLASSMFAPAIGQVMSNFHSDNSLLASFVVSVYILGFALGPLAIAPLSELYGRLPLYHATNITFVLFTVACALSSSLNMLIGFRFLAGISGSAVLTIGGGTVADMFIQEERGKAMAVWTVGPLLGPTIGPVAGAFIAEAKGWRWIFWIVAVGSSIITLVFMVIMRESSATTILEHKARCLRRQTGIESLRSKLDTGVKPKELFKLALTRPVRMLLFSPIILCFSIFMAVVYGYLYLLFTTITGVFTTRYSFSQGLVGLSYLGIGVGMLIGVFGFGTVSDRILKKKAAGGELKPEGRLPPMIPGAIIIPAGLFLYGWSADYNVFWLVPILGTALVGMGLNITFMSIQTYLVDAYTPHAASALAANTLLRSTVGAILPLAGPSLYARIGLGWGTSLLGFISVAMIPFPFLFIKYGEAIRANPRFQPQL